MIQMVRTTEKLYEENEALEKLIEKKENEVFKLKQRIQKNTELISKKKEIEDRTISAYVISYKDRLSTIRVIDTNEIFQYWGWNRPETYIKITSRWLEQLRDTKKKNEEGYFNQ